LESAINKAFAGLKVDVYGMKGGHLRDERWTFTGWKVDICGMKEMKIVICWK